jgi:hypothetical protein
MYVLKRMARNVAIERYERMLAIMRVPLAHGVAAFIPLRPTRRKCDTNTKIARDARSTHATALNIRLVNKNAAYSGESAASLSQ